MGHKSKTRLVSVIVFAVTVVLFVSFFVYLSANERLDVYSPRYSPHYGRIINLVPKTVKDDHAPLGVHTEYQWLMDAHCETGDFLCFYVANHSVKVTVDGELVYALSSADGPSMVRNISSNWCIIPLEPRDAGRLFTVRLTPMVAETVHKDVEFLIGSDYNIVLEQLREDTVQLILGVMCIALGMIIFLIQLYLQIFSGSSQIDILYMGVVSVLLGVWRMSDICAAPLIFTKNAGILGYISDSILLVGGSALILFAATRVREKHAPKVHILGVIACSIALLLLGLQVFGVIEIAEFKFVSYGMLILGSIMLILASIFSKKDDSANKSQFTWKLLPIVTVGIVLDFVTFYQNKSSSTLIYTTLFFLIFMAITFIASFRETSKMAYQDSRTGLFNKARWNELMHGGDDINEPIGILVLDLNGLKQVNDTLGHEAGDVMISAFAEILKNVLPSSSVICRWGGDEFAVWFPKISRQKLDSYTEALLRAAEDYNATEPAARISFAMGAILAEEHPGMSRSDLFHLADDQMYSNKRKWYAGKVMSKGKK